MIQRILLLAILACTFLTLSGCGKTETTATKEETEKWANPDKTPPPGAGAPAPATPEASGE